MKEKTCHTPAVATLGPRGHPVIALIDDLAIRELDSSEEEELRQQGFISDDFTTDEEDTDEEEECPYQEPQSDSQTSTDAPSS